MKNQVLFVDDEPLILEGLKRMLRVLRDQWDMHFVESGEKALAVMEERPIHVVVSDMRMPGMNGAELLNRVKERHPETVRLILSGYADRDLILGCVGSTHQYLSKPCEPETLLAAVTRAIELESSLQNERMRRLISQMESIPSMPSLYGEIVDRTSDPDVTLEEIAETIAKDPAMTAKILKLVNSAFFGLRRDISNLSEAISYLGIETIKSLVLTVNAFSQFEGRSYPGFSMEQIWSHSLAVASGAKQIAREEGCKPKVREEAFVGGMLHDVGKLILGVNFPEEYAEVLRKTAAGQTLAEAERECFGADHADIGGALLGLWGLPGAVVEAIALHHRPLISPSREFNSLTAVYAANQLAKGSSNLLEDEYLAAMNVENRGEAWQEAIDAPLD